MCDNYKNLINHNCISQPEIAKKTKCYLFQMLKMLPYKIMHLCCHSNK